MGPRLDCGVTGTHGTSGRDGILTVRRLAADEWRAYRELRLRALADSPDAFSSTFTVERALPEAHWAERVSTGVASDGNCPLVAVVKDRFVGLVWGRIDPKEPQIAHVYQMWVEPRCRAMGIGSALLHEVIAWARKAGSQRAVLAVTCGDTAARRLYARAGFVPVGDLKPIRADSALLSLTMSLSL